MFTRIGARPRTFAAFVAALTASAALVLLPALPATADDAPPDLPAAAAAARADADSAHAAAEAAAAAAETAAAEATSARAAADTACLAATAAADALALAPDDVALQDAATAAQTACDDADAAADVAEAASTTAADAAAAALANAAVLEEAALAAEAAAAADPSPPGEEVEPLADPAGRFFEPECDNAPSFASFSFEEWDWCFPDPYIEIEVVNICPTEIEVKISNLLPWADYTVYVDGYQQSIYVDVWGDAKFTVTDFTSGKFEVEVYHNYEKIAYESAWIHSFCPSITTDVEHECTTIDGNAEVEVTVSDLKKWLSYDIVITGPDGYYYDVETWWQEYWSEDLYLDPGLYTVTVTSDGNWHVPHIGPVVYEFTVAPCPGEVIITIVPTCSTDGSGSLGASLSGLVPGREYNVTVEGPSGIVTDVTFVASESTWAVPPAHLPPGTYTVTVIDTESSTGEYWATVKYEEPVYDPLTWTATGTITACPTLASTGLGFSQELVPALSLIPIGAGLLLAGVYRRRTIDEIDAEETS